MIRMRAQNETPNNETLKAMHSSFKLENSLKNDKTHEQTDSRASTKPQD